MNVEEKRKKKHEKKVERNDHKTLKVFARAGMKKILSVCDSHSKTPHVPVEIFNRIFPSPTSWISRISFQRTVYERWGRDQGWYASCSLFNATWMRIHVGNGFLGWTTCFWNYKCQFFPSLVNSIFPNRRMRQQSINFSSKLLFQRIQIYLFVQRAEFLLSFIKIYSIVPEIDCSIYKKREEKDRGSASRESRILTVGTNSRRDFQYREERNGAITLTAVNYPVTLWLRVNIHAMQQKKKASQTTTTTTRRFEQARSLFLSMNQQRKLGNYTPMFYSTVSICFSTTTHLFAPSTLLQHVLFLKPFLLIYLVELF